jgi:transposase-like protein
MVRAPERLEGLRTGDGRENGAREEDLLSKVGRGRIARFGCPRCGGDEIRPGGKPRYRCMSCRKTFNPLTRTPLAGLHHQDRWPDQARALIAGETVKKAAERCRVAYTTAFRWRHRFLSALIPTNRCADPGSSRRTRPSSSILQPILVP